MAEVKVRVVRPLSYGAQPFAPGDVAMMDEEMARHLESRGLVTDVSGSAEEPAPPAIELDVIEPGVIED